MSSTSELSFLPDDYLERKAQRRTNAVCAVLFCLIMGGIGSAFYLSEQATHKDEKANTQANSQYMQAYKRIEQFRQVEEKQKRMSLQVDLTSTLVEKCNRSNILAEITKYAGQNVRLVDFTLESKPRVTGAPVETKTAYEQRKAAREAARNPGAAAGTAAAAQQPKVFDVHMKITGVAQTDLHVAPFLREISRSEAFKDVNLIISEEHTMNEQKLRKFQIELTLNPNAESEKVGQGKPAAVVEVETSK